MRDKLSSFIGFLTSPIGGVKPRSSSSIGRNRSTPPTKGAMDGLANWRAAPSAARVPQRMATDPSLATGSGSASLGPARHGLATQRRRHAGRLPCCAALALQCASPQQAYMDGRAPRGSRPTAATTPRCMVVVSDLTTWRRGVVRRAGLEKGGRAGSSGGSSARLIRADGQRLPALVIVLSALSARRNQRALAF